MVVSAFIIASSSFRDFQQTSIPWTTLASKAFPVVRETTWYLPDHRFIGEKYTDKSDLRCQSGVFLYSELTITSRPNVYGNSTFPWFSNY